MKLVPADGRLLQRIVATTPLVAHHGLSREAVAKYDSAQAKTPWALWHRRRFALMQADDVPANAATPRSAVGQRNLEDTTPRRRVS
jgi:hypothetical protein